MLHVYTDSVCSLHKMHNSKHDAILKRLLFWILEVKPELLYVEELQEKYPILFSFKFSKQKELNVVLKCIYYIK